MKGCSCDPKYRACPLLKKYVAAGWLGRANPTAGFILTVNDGQLGTNEMRLITFLITLGAIALLLGVAIFIPYTFTALPECRIFVTNLAGKPVDNAEAYETGGYFDLGRSWVEKKVTDREGKVTFPARKVRASLIQRAIARLLMRRLIHMSGGPVGLVSVCDEGRYAEQDISPGKSDGNIKLVLVAGPCRRD
jgi:hypothetical protein